LTARDRRRRHPLRLPELVGRDRRQWTVLLVRIRREDALEAVRRRDEANRYILI
jgi:hypothetical protein